MSEAQTESPPVSNRWVRISIAAPPEGVDVEMTEDGLLWRTKPRKVVQVFQSAPDPEAEAARIAAKAAQILSQSDWVEVTHISGRRKAAAAWFDWREHVRDAARGKRLDIPAEPDRWDTSPPPAEPAPEHRFPASLDEKLGDWDIPEEGADNAEKQKIVSGFIDILKSGKDVADNTFRQMSADDRVKLFPILNNELSRLTNEEALLNKPIPRRGDVQSLLGILAKVGEA